jgi:hypothetical protein
MEQDLNGLFDKYMLSSEKIEKNEHVEKLSLNTDKNETELVSIIIEKNKLITELTLYIKELQSLKEKEQEMLKQEINEKEIEIFKLTEKLEIYLKGSDIDIIQYYENLILKMELSYRNSLNIYKFNLTDFMPFSNSPNSSIFSNINNKSTISNSSRKQVNSLKRVVANLLKQNEYLENDLKSMQKTQRAHFNYNILMNKFGEKIEQSKR